MSTPPTAAVLGTSLNTILRLAEHLASEAMLHGCEITASPNDADDYCAHDAVAIRWENGFADSVCEYHANRAAERGALVVYPKRHNGEHQSA
jgi:hypothetical protein